MVLKHHRTGGRTARLMLGCGARRRSISAIECTSLYEIPALVFTQNSNMLATRLKTHVYLYSHHTARSTSAIALAVVTTSL